MIESKKYIVYLLYTNNYFVPFSIFLLVGNCQNGYIHNPTESLPRSQTWFEGWTLVLCSMVSRFRIYRSHYHGYICSVPSHLDFPWQETCRRWIHLQYWKHREDQSPHNSTKRIRTKVHPSNQVCDRGRLSVGLCM
jgi:hypothetical protein